MMRLFVYILVALATMSTVAIGYDMIDSRALGLGRTVDLDAPSPTSLLRAPSSALKSDDWMIETGYHRRFELADLDDLFVVGAWRKKSFTLAFGASQYGKTDLYAEQLLKGTALFHWRDFTLGGTLSAMQVKIGDGYGDLRAASFGFGLGYRRGIVRLAFTADDLGSPSLAVGSLEEPREYRLYAQVMSHKSYSFTGLVDWEAGEKTQLGLGQIIKLSRNASLFWGIASEPLEYGGGLEIKIPVGAVTYATSVHPTLGFSHTITVSFSPSLKSRGGGDDF